MQCPKCGHVRQSTDTSPKDECPSCGIIYSKFRKSAAPERPKLIVKTYKGSQEQATRLFQQDAPKMAANGYFPSSQSFVPGAWGCGNFIFALILCFLLIGIIALIYMLLVKPDGVLSVTYEYRGTAASRAAAEKTCPKCAEQVKAAASVCRFCGHQF